MQSHRGNQVTAPSTNKYIHYTGAQDEHVPYTVSSRNICNCSHNIFQEHTQAIAGTSNLWNS